MDLIDRAALLSKLRKERDEYVHDHFVMDPDTGVYEGGRAKENYLGYLEETIEVIENFPAAEAAEERVIEGRSTPEIEKWADEAFRSDT